MSSVDIVSSDLKLRYAIAGQRKLLVFASTPSDGRWLKNAMAQLRRDIRNDANPS